MDRHPLLEPLFTLARLISPSDVYPPEAAQFPISNSHFPLPNCQVICRALVEDAEMSSRTRKATYSLTCISRRDRSLVYRYSPALLRNYCAQYRDLAGRCAESMADTTHGSDPPAKSPAFVSRLLDLHTYILRLDCSTPLAGPTCIMAGSRSLKAGTSVTNPGLIRPPYR